MPDVPSADLRETILEALRHWMEDEWERAESVLDEYVATQKCQCFICKAFRKDKAPDQKGGSD